MKRGGNRPPNVPPVIDSLGALVSKSDLLEACFQFALFITGEGDEAAAADLLVNEFELAGKQLRVPTKWVDSQGNTELRQLLRARKLRKREDEV